MRGFARLMRLGRSQPPEHLHEIIPEHTRIVDALENRDVDAALAALQAHLHHWDYLLEPHHTAETDVSAGR
jgi:DNA-binding GntR family transcriptional regulator